LVAAAQVERVRAVMSPWTCGLELDCLICLKDTSVAGVTTPLSFGVYLVWFVGLAGWGTRWGA
jgi:hypothetical protein